MTQVPPNSFRTGPDIRGHFGAYGGRFVAETLMPLVLDLERAYEAAKRDPSFQAELDGLLNSVVAAADNIQFVLEVKDGWFARHNIGTGTIIRTENGSLAETFFRRQ